MSRTIIVNDSMQKGYRYICTEPTGKHFASDFLPDLTPQEMMELGVFGGTYFNNEIDEYPHSWFRRAKRPQRLGEKSDAEVNYFGVAASQTLQEWQRKGWIHPQDPRGWFQWYCRYYLGRRTDDDARQIKRWRAMKRHVAQIRASCHPGDLNCRKRQRQALLHWAYDSRNI